MILPLIAAAAEGYLWEIAKVALSKLARVGHNKGVWALEQATQGNRHLTKPEAVQDIFGECSWCDFWGCHEQGQELYFSDPCESLPTRNIQ